MESFPTAADPTGDLPIQLSGLLIQPLAARLRDWSLAGKLCEDDFERALTHDGRALLDTPLPAADWAPLRDVEGLVSLAADQLGGEPGLVDWADEIVTGWKHSDSLARLLRGARALVDAPGFVVSQASELLVREPDWRYDGGRSAFAVRLRGLGSASPALKALVGALLARLATEVQVRDFDVRFDGVDGQELVVFGEVEVAEESADDEDAANDESRLHRAALVG